VESVEDVVAGRSGTSARFTDLFEAESRRLGKAMYLLTGDRAEAEDLAQEAFVRVYERWNTVGAMDSPAGYLYRVALNLWHRQARRLRRLPGLPAGTGAMDPAVSVEARSEVIRLLLALSPEQREAVVLVEWLGLTAEEAGRALGIDPSSVRGRIHRARLALRGEAEEVPDG
jgi:RNA polymerase sigma factor (sigma-70 family)